MALLAEYDALPVAPFTGAWIEMLRLRGIQSAEEMSHPSRVRGLKYARLLAEFFGQDGRTLHGCVD